MRDYIFSLDPGSIKSGWSVVDRSERLIEAGLLLPDKTHQLPEFRINSQCQSLFELLNQYQPQTVLIEWPSGHVGRKRHSGGGAGLTVFGCACGALWREALCWKRLFPIDVQLQVKIILIRESEWCRGIPKQKRAEAVAATFPKYRLEDDRGLDIADSLGLTVYWLREQSVKLAEVVT